MKRQLNRYHAALLVAAVVQWATSGIALTPASGQSVELDVIVNDFLPLADDRAQKLRPLAAAGYCVVTLRDRQEWVPGDKNIAAVFDGQRYLFSGPRQRAIFTAAPVRYAPALGGDCVVTFVDSGERVAGRPQHAAVYGGRLFFFVNDTCRSDFLHAPAKFKDVDLAEGGLCPVSRLDKRRHVPGIPATVLIRHGMRRFFANAHAQSLYLQHPERYDDARNQPNSQRSASASAPTLDDAGNAIDANDSDLTDAQAAVHGRKSAMGGYCPVTIRQSGEWVRGRYDYRAEFGPLTFLTAGPAELQMLNDNPAKYIPALGGDCAASLVDDDTRIPGSIFHAVEFEERLYLFADASRKAAFKANPKRYALADVAEQGTCVVTLRDQRRDVAGLSEFSTWHSGWLYRFSSAEQRDKFLANPAPYAVPASR